MKEKKELSVIFKELIEPFRNLLKTPKAHTGLNISYIIEGFTYFGFIGLLAIFFNKYLELDDIEAGLMVGYLTGGITFSQLLLGATVDWVGIRKAMLISLLFMLVGRLLISLSPIIAGGVGLWSGSHIVTILGIFGIVLGYGIYQPAAYTAVKRFTNEKTSAMGYAMLYALMNLGGFLPGIISPPLRKEFDIVGVFYFIVILTGIGVLVVFYMINDKSVKEATENSGNINNMDDDELKNMSSKDKFKYYLHNFPLKDLRFLFFIFILIPVQTLFAHNWLTLPQYTSRAFTGFVQENFEFFVNLNPILIFILTPIVTALTSKKNAYSMMIIGTFIMAFPALFLVIDANIYTLFAYLILMTIGEAMWQPRFLQWVAEIAPKNMTGIYMGIGQFPWFLTKVITSLYSGWFLMKYVPDGVEPEKLNSEYMWLIYSLIALTSPVALLLAKKWMLLGFKEKHS